MRRLLDNTLLEPFNPLSQTREIGELALVGFILPD